MEPVKITIEAIQALLRGKEVNFNSEVRILPPQRGLFITKEELDDVIADRTNTVNRLLCMMEKG